MENEIKNHEIEKQVLADAEEILLLKAKLDVIVEALSDFVHKETASTHLEVISKTLDRASPGFLSTDSENLVFVWTATIPLY